MSLSPGRINDISGPVGIAQSAIFRIDSHGKDAFSTLFDTPVAAFAGVKKVRLFHGAPVSEIVLENAVDAFLLDAFLTTAGAILTKFYRGIFTNGGKAGIGHFGMNMIFLRHARLQYSLGTG
jgi:hypothetical protein